MPSLPPRSAIKDALLRHHAGVSAVTYGTILFRGATFENVAITRRPGELRNEEGGLLDQSELTVRIAKHRISLPPRALEIITITGTTWKIASVAGDQAWEQEWVMHVTKQ